MKWQEVHRPMVVPLVRLLRGVRMIGEKGRVVAIGGLERAVGQTGRMEATVGMRTAHQDGEVSRHQEEESIKTKCTLILYFWGGLETGRKKGKRNQSLAMYIYFNKLERRPWPKKRPLLDFDELFVEKRWRGQ